MIHLPLQAAREVAIHLQGLDHPAPPPASHQAITAMIERTGAIQIDTIYKVQRSQYITVWSRFGQYDTQLLDDLIFTDGQRTTFEYWKHAACIIPFSEYRYHTAAMAHRRDNLSPWWQKRMAHIPDFEQVLEAVRERIRTEGGQRTADFKGKGQPQWGGWASWKPAKLAMEHLFNIGELMISDRVNNFQRVYDLAERVIPPHVDVTPHTIPQRRRYLLEQAARSAGIASPEGIIDYAYMKRTPARPIMADLVAEGTLIEVEVQSVSGQTVPMLAHRDNLPILQQARDGELPARRTTFLSFFDSLFWAADRDEMLWGFTNTLEAYKKKKDRRWGYFCLPILHRDALVGRFDPTLDRRSGRLTLHALYLEDTPLTDDLIAAVAEAMRSFMAFHQATDLVIERSDPPAFAQRLMAAL